MVNLDSPVGEGDQDGQGYGGGGGGGDVGNAKPGVVIITFG